MGTKRLIRIIAFLAVGFFILFGPPLFASAHGPVFTQEEQEYIKNKGTIKVVVIDGGAPKQYIDSKGKIKGIAINVLEEIKVISGLDFEYVLYNSIAHAIKDEPEIFAILSKEYQPPGIILSKPYLYSETIIFHNSSLNPKELEGKRYAAVRGGTIPEGIKEENVIYFDDREATFKAVNEGKADYGYSNTYSLVFHALQNGYDNIVTIPQKQEDRAYCVGVKEGDEILLSIINKSLEAINENQMQSLILSALADVEKKLA